MFTYCQDCAPGRRWAAAQPAADGAQQLLPQGRGPVCRRRVRSVRRGGPVSSRPRRLTLRGPGRRAMGIRDIAARWLAPRGAQAPRSNRRRPPAWLVLLLALGALSIHVVTAPPGATAAAAPEPARGPAADSGITGPRGLRRRRARCVAARSAAAGGAHVPPVDARSHARRPGVRPCLAGERPDHRRPERHPGGHDGRGVGRHVVAAYSDSALAAEGEHRTGWGVSTNGGASFTDQGTLPSGPSATAATRSSHPIRPQAGSTSPR